MSSQTITDENFRELYRSTMSRTIEVALDHEAELHRIVPSCPAWTARDLLGHLTGIAEVWAAHRLDHYATEPWTREQIERNRDRNVQSLLGVWHDTVTTLGSVEADPVMGNPGGGCSATRSLTRPTCANCSSQAAIHPAKP